MRHCGLGVKTSIRGIFIFYSPPTTHPVFEIMLGCTSARWVLIHAKFENASTDFFDVSDGQSTLRILNLTILTLEK